MKLYNFHRSLIEIYNFSATDRLRERSMPLLIDAFTHLLKLYFFSHTRYFNKWSKEVASRLSYLTNYIKKVNLKDYDYFKLIFLLNSTDLGKIPNQNDKEQLKQLAYDKFHDKSYKDWISEVNSDLYEEGKKNLRVDETKINVSKLFGFLLESSEYIIQKLIKFKRSNENYFKTEEIIKLVNKLLLKYK